MMMRVRIPPYKGGRGIWCQKHEINSPTCFQNTVAIAIPSPRFFVNSELQKKANHKKPPLLSKQGFFKQIYAKLNSRV
jgi:hypothetical protein